jgi:uncharacterized protein (DUF1800 family)
VVGLGAFAARIRQPFSALLVCALALCAECTRAADTQATPTGWTNDLRPLDASQWNRERAAHLLERAGFGATPQEIESLLALGLRAAVGSLVRPQGIDDPAVGPFEPSGIPDSGIDPFPESRPATTDMAKANGEALGVEAKPAGNRRLQPVVNKFFFWLRVSALECNRISYWWANRMLVTRRPLVEKMALFWHGHFATHEDKVRDYRKMLQQIELFQQQGLVNFRDLMIAVAQDPAMLAFLDAGINVKDAPNENFAREILEMFTMGVGRYSERDIRESARAFTGWNYTGTRFIVNADMHDDGEKNVFGRAGRFDGVQVIDLILAQPATAEYLASRIYKYFVREDIAPETARRLAAVLRENGYAIAPLLETIFLSRDFYSSASVGTRIKSPVELVISTYRKLGLTSVPGLPDFNDVTRTLGQYLLHPPTVAGWAYGKAWITPGLLIERGNFVHALMFPDFMAVANDRYPQITVGAEVRAVHERLARGFDITAATSPDATATMGDGAAMSQSNRMDRDEDFNTRYGSYRGWQKAVEVIKPIPRTMAHIDLTAMVLAGGAATTGDAVDLLARRFFSVPIARADRDAWTAFLTQELGTDRIERARTYMEDGLRELLHLMLSSPDYQLG